MIIDSFVKLFVLLMLAAVTERFICAVSVEKDALTIKLGCETVDAHEIHPTELKKSFKHAV